MTIGERILEQLAKQPGMTTRELADLLGKRFQQINGECRALENAHRVRVDRTQRPHRCYLNEDEAGADAPETDYAAEFSRIIRSVSALLGKPIEGGFEIIDRGCPHEPKTLKRGMMGVYTFLYDDAFLKIGRAGPSSGPRFYSQHYNPASAQSTLAGSLLADPEFADKGITTENVGAWIRQNTRRIDILMDEALGLFALELVEAALHYRYYPRYEGFKSQRERGRKA